MKIKRCLNKLKKIIITFVCCITLVFTMPIKTKAGILDDFVSILLSIPDGIMFALNYFVAQNKDVATRWGMEYKGFDEGSNAYLYNFDVTPYDIFTNGLEYTFKEESTYLENVVVSQDVVNFFDNYKSVYDVDLRVSLNHYVYEEDGTRYILLENTVVPLGDNILENAIESDFISDGNEELLVSPHRVHIYNKYETEFSVNKYYINGDDNITCLEAPDGELYIEIVSADYNFGGFKEVYGVKLGIFDANFFRSNEVKSENGGHISSVILTPVISNVYRALRNLCILLMMLVLLYIGIRIILSSSAKDQSKYKNWLMDWLMGFCLLFCMHFIMSFLHNMNSVIVNMLANDDGDTFYFGAYELAYNSEGQSDVVVEMIADENTEPNNVIGEKAFELFGKVGMWLMSAGDNELSEWALIAGYINDGISEKKRNYMIEHIIVYNGWFPGESFPVDFSTGIANVEDENVLELGYSNYNPTTMARNWSKGTGKIQLDGFYVNGKKWDDLTYVKEDFAVKAIVKLNLMEYVRTVGSHELDSKANMYMYNNTGAFNYGSTPGWDEKMAYIVIYIVMVVETVMFSIIYIKRVFILAMYTMLAPLIAFMYPIDKLGDSKAQALNKWLKDYFFTLLTQPLHLLLYTIFIVSVMSLLKAGNFIYAICMYGMMIPGEKYIKEILGFNKSSSGGGPGMAGAAGAGLAMHGLSKLTGLGPHGHGPRGGGSDKNGISNKIRKRKPNGIEGLAPGSDGLGSAGNNFSNSNLAQKGRKPASNARNVLNANNNKSGRMRNLGRKALNSMGRAARFGGRKVNGAITGNPNSKFRGHKKDWFKSAGVNIGRKGLKGGIRIAGRAGGAIGLGAIGGIAGVTTAMTTGDTSNITKGLLIGGAAGWKQGGAITDWGVSKTGGLYNEYKQYHADTDQEYQDKLRQKEQLDSFKGENLTDEQTSFVKQYAPYVDFDGDMDKLEGMMQARDFLGPNATMEDVINSPKLSSKFDLNSSQGRKDAEAFLANEAYQETAKKLQEKGITKDSVISDQAELNRKATELEDAEIRQKRINLAKKLKEVGDDNFAKDALQQDFAAEVKAIRNNHAQYQEKAKSQAYDKIVQANMDTSGLNNQLNAAQAYQNKTKK